MVLDLDVAPEEGLDRAAHDDAATAEIALSPTRLRARGFNFDPTKHFRKLRGRGKDGKDGDYLDVKWRVLWFRTENPEGIIETRLLSHETVGNTREAVFHCIVTIPGGGVAHAHGSETKTDFGDYLEKAETKAIGRALENLGYGTAAASEDPENAIVENTYEHAGRGRQQQEPRRESRPEPRREEERPRESSRYNGSRDEPRREAEESRHQPLQGALDENAPQPPVAWDGQQVTSVRQAATVMKVAADERERQGFFGTLVAGKWQADALKPVKKAWEDAKAGR